METQEDESLSSQNSLEIPSPTKEMIAQLNEDAVIVEEDMSTGDLI